jgi:hypothetical protein
MKRFFGRLRCRHGFHAWEECNNPFYRFCRRCARSERFRFLPVEGGSMEGRWVISLQGDYDREMR